MRNIVVLGATGSIGTQTLEVLAAFPETFNIVGLSGGCNMGLLAAQVKQFQPQRVVVKSLENRAMLQTILSQQDLTMQAEVLVGEEGLLALVSQANVDVVVNGLSGFVGLLPTLEALKAGKKLLTANKETFVTAGHLVRPYLSQIVPLDSEHSAIFQCLQGTTCPAQQIKTLYLTASGGPFRDTPLEQLPHVSIEQALKHPNWTMGDKITIDSATMMNKGLEMIEAHVLFGTPFESIRVVIHPQSIVHSAVAFIDGSMLAQMGVPDMRVPIQYGLFYPQREATPFPQLELDLTQLGGLEFMPADEVRFPCLALARWAGEVGGTMPVVLNAADEMAVAAFLAGNIGFMDIPKLIERLMHQHQTEHTLNPDLNTILAVDTWTREQFNSLLSPVIA